MKRILIFSLAYYPHIGGAEVAIKEITDRVDDVDFSLITLNMGNDKREESLGRVRVYRLGNGSSYVGKIFFVPLAAIKAWRLHRVHHFDGFWAMMSYMLFPIVLLRYMGVRPPYALTLQEGDPWKHMFGRWFILPFRPLISYGFRNASVVQTISTYLLEWAKKMGYPGHVEVIPNGCDTWWFSENSVGDRAVFWDHHGGVPGKGPVLITTSRLVEKNAVDVIIRALALLPPDFCLAVLGRGPERMKLDRLAQELGVADRVRFYEEIPNTKVVGYLHASDIFVRPSRSEGMGNSFIEAMAAGLPVVATQEGGIADFLFDARRNPQRPTTGWAVERDDPVQIAEAVQEIVTHRETADQVTANAKEMVAKKYDWNLIAKNMRERVFGLLFDNHVH